MAGGIIAGRSDARWGAPAPVPLWVWPLAGLAIGFGTALLRLAVGRVGVVAAIIVALACAGNPGTRRHRRLDRMHERVAAGKPLLR